MRTTILKITIYVWIHNIPIHRSLTTNSTHKNLKRKHEEILKPTSGQVNELTVMTKFWGQIRIPKNHANQRQERTKIQRCRANKESCRKRTKIQELESKSCSSKKKSVKRETGRIRTLKTAHEAIPSVETAVPIEISRGNVPALITMSRSSYSAK